MPQAQRQPTEDDYWAATDKELVTLRGCVEYIGGTICGFTRTRNNVPNGGSLSTAPGAFLSSDGVYPTVNDQRISFTPGVSTYTDTVTGRWGNSINWVDAWDNLNTYSEVNLNAASTSALPLRDTFIAPWQEALHQRERAIREQQAVYMEAYASARQNSDTAFNTTPGVRL